MQLGSSTCTPSNAPFCVVLHDFSHVIPARKIKQNSNFLIFHMNEKNCENFGILRLKCTVEKISNFLDMKNAPKRLVKLRVPGSNPNGGIMFSYRSKLL